MLGLDLVVGLRGDDPFGKQLRGTLKRIAGSRVPGLGSGKIGTRLVKRQAVIARVDGHHGLIFFDRAAHFDMVALNNPGDLSRYHDLAVGHQMSDGAEHHRQIPRFDKPGRDRAGGCCFRRVRLGRVTAVKGHCGGRQQYQHPSRVHRNNNPSGRL